MRDAETAHPVLPLWAKLLLVTGFAAAGWLLAAALGGPAASAAESPDQNTNTDHVPALGRLLGGTLNTVTDTVHTTLDTTLTTATSTVGTTLTTVTNTVTTTVNTVTDAIDTATETVVAPATRTVLRPITTSRPAVATHAKTSGSGTVTQTRADTTAAAPAEKSSTPAMTAPARAAQSGPAEPAAPQPSRHHLIAAQPKAIEPGHDAQARDGAPKPAPTQPPAPSGAVTASHDGGGNGKDPLAILTTHAGTSDLQPIGTPRRNTFVDNSRDPALPTTSPD